MILKNIWHHCHTPTSFCDKQQDKLHEKRANTEFFSVPYFPAISPNTGKYRSEKTPYLDIFQAAQR